MQDAMLRTNICGSADADGFDLSFRTYGGAALIGESRHSFQKYRWVTISRSRRTCVGKDLPFGVYNGQSKVCSAQIDGKHCFAHILLAWRAVGSWYIIVLVVTRYISSTDTNSIVDLLAQSTTH